MTTPEIDSVAIQVCDMAAMVGFYIEAFGADLEEIDVGGPEAWFGRIGGVMFKLVAVRELPEFEGFPHHQLGFVVPDVEAVVDIAERWGGRQASDVVRREDGEIHGVVRDPDGNTIELRTPAG
ncbi:MAG: VOC family protein [Planctomycetota bacterium]|jgi:catechol 2,3-dioxygenase-like lactoylglutathione lyase family enzyme